MDLSKDTAGDAACAIQPLRESGSFFSVQPPRESRTEYADVWSLATIRPHSQLGPARRLLRTLHARLAADVGGVANAKTIVTPRVCCEGGRFIVQALACMGCYMHASLHLPRSLPSVFGLLARHIVQGMAFTLQRTVYRRRRQ